MAEEKNLEEELDETSSEVQEEVAEAEEQTESVNIEEVEAEDEASQEETDEKAEKKGKLFKKDKKEDKLKAQLDEEKDKYVRLFAEFENFRNRTQKEKDAMFETGAKSVIEKILPVVDNFERGIAALSEEEKENSFAKGMLGIYKQLTDELDKLDVKPIEAVGKEFDPNLHNAVMQTESDEYESGVVAQELQKGYTYRDQVVRHSMVAVVQ